MEVVAPTVGRLQNKPWGENGSGPDACRIGTRRKTNVLKAGQVGRLETLLALLVLALGCQGVADCLSGALFFGRRRIGLYIDRADERAPPGWTSLQHA